MRRQICMVGMVLAMAGTLGLVIGCNHDNAKAKEAKDSTQKEQSKPRIVENVDLAPGKSITPQDQAKVSSIAMKVLVHISKAQQEVAAKNVDGAKKDMAQAESLIAILKEILPSVKIIDHIQVAKSNLASYIETTEVQQDLVTIMASVNQLYDVLPEGKAKEHAKQAEEALTKEKEKGAAKAKESLEARRGIPRLQRSRPIRFARLPVDQVGPGIPRQGRCQRSRRGVDRDYGRGHVRRL